MYKKILWVIFPFALVTSLAFIVVYKAVNLPLTFDEVVTCERYTTNASAVNIMFAADGSSNNHILNSLSIKCVQVLLGNRPWALRLPNIAAFLLFAICTIILSKKYFRRTHLLFIIPLLVFLLNPYLLDFFGLARGYGMASAFTTCSVVCLLLFARDSKQIKWHYSAIVFAMLAGYANFAFLIYWAAVHLILAAILVFHNRRNSWQTATITIFTAIAFVTLCYFPLKSMQQCIESTFGDHTGFYYDTLLSSANRYMYSITVMGFSGKTLSAVIGITGIIAAIRFIVKIKKNKSSAVTDPFNLLFLLLVLAWLINMLQVFCFNTSYLSGRTALIYVILFSFVLVFLIRDLAIQKPLIAQLTAGIISIIITWHFINAVNLTSVYEWSFDAYTYNVMQYIEDYKLQHPELKSIELNLTCFFRPSLSFHQKTKGIGWLTLDNPQNTMADTSSTALFYYTTADHITELKNYTEVKRFMPNGVLLPIAGASPVQVLLIHR